MSRPTRTGQGLVTQLPPVGILRPLAYTPTVTWTNQTLTTQSGFYLKTPGVLTLWIAVNVSVAGAAGAITITIPAGYTAVTQTGSISSVVGTWFNPSAAGSVIYAAAAATTQITSAATTLAAGTTGTAGGMFIIPTLT